MSDDSCDHNLAISEPLFRLTAESLRLRTNETNRHQTLGDLVDDRATFARNIDHRVETLRDHLEIVPSTGDINISLKITRSSEENLEHAQAVLAERLGRDLTLVDALSVLLFDYMVERKSNDVLTKLLAQTSSAWEALGQPCDPPSAGNVVPFSQTSGGR